MIEAESIKETAQWHARVKKVKPEDKQSLRSIAEKREVLSWLIEDLLKEYDELDKNFDRITSKYPGILCGTIRRIVGQPSRVFLLTRRYHMEREKFNERFPAKP
jgi:hypothetical protein